MFVFVTHFFFLSLISRFITHFFIEKKRVDNIKQKYNLFFTIHHNNHMQIYYT